MTPNLRVAAAAGLASSLLLAACGGGAASSSGPSAAGSPSKAASQVQGLPADQVLAKAKAALASAKSVHFAASGSDADSGKIDFDLHLATGANATGTIAISGQELKLIRTGQTAYVSGSDALVAGLSQGKATSGKWVKLPASTPGLSGLLDIADLSKGMGDVLKTKGKISLGTPKVVDGKQTVALVDSDPDGGTLYVSAEGTPYPLRIEPAAGSKNPATATFTEYDAPLTVTPPPASDVVEVPGG